MKKHIAILLLLMYSLSVSGSVVQLHFCGNNLKSFSVNAAEAKTCCCPVKETSSQEQKFEDAEKKSCCSQTDINLKIDVDQTAINGMAQLQLLQMAAFIPQDIKPVFDQSVPTKFHTTSYAAHAPPNGNWQQIPLYKLFRSLVYYG